MCDGEPCRTRSSACDSAPGSVSGACFAGSRWARARLRYLVRCRSRDQQGRRVARLVGEPHHPTPSSYRAILRGGTASGWLQVPMSRSLLHLRQQRRQSELTTAIASQVSVPLSPAASITARGSSSRFDARVAAPEWKFFLIPPGEYEICDTWFMAGMQADRQQHYCKPTTCSCRTPGRQACRTWRWKGAGWRAKRERYLPHPILSLASHVRTANAGVLPGAHKSISANGRRRARQRTARRQATKPASRYGWPGLRPTQTFCRPRGVCLRPDQNGSPLVPARHSTFSRLARVLE